MKNAFNRKSHSKNNLKICKYFICNIKHMDNSESEILVELYSSLYKLRLGWLASLNVLCMRCKFRSQRWREVEMTNHRAVKKLRAKQEILIH